MNKPITPVQKAQEIMRQLSNQQTEGLNDFIKEVHEAISSESDIKKIPINVFESVFKPYLTGKEESTNDKNFIAHWAGLVGPTSPAEVVDIQGNKLFTVPPLYDSSLINTTERRGSVSNIIQNYERDVGVNPAVATRDFALGVADTLERNISKDEKYSWDEMLQYYNKKDVPVATKQTKLEANPNDFDFDE